jgi:hypothetical protein
MQHNKKVKLDAPITVLIGSTIDIEPPTSANVKIEPTTLVALRAYIRPNPKHRGHWGTALKYMGKYGVNGVDLPNTYTPNERGFHVLIMTTVQDDVAYTFRSGVIKVK